MASYKDTQVEMTRKNLEEIKNQVIKDAHKSRQNQAMSFFDKFTNKEGRLLDVGCRDGGFMEVLKSRGYKDLTGIDISKEAVDICFNKGLTCYHGDIQECNMFEEEYFDTILLSHILEHCEKPQDALARCNEFLIKGGVLLIEVPIESKPTKIPTVWAHYHTFQSECDLLKLLIDNGFPTCKGLLKDSSKNKWIRAVFQK